MPSLYQLSTEFVASLESAFDAETGEALPSFDQKRELWQGKGAAVAAYILDIEGDAAKAKAAIERIKKLQIAYERKAEALKAYLADNMKTTGITEIRGDDFAVKLHVNRDESVELDDGIAWPVSLCNEPKPPTPSKTKIKAAILAGEPVAGARIVKSDRLTIK